LCFKRLWLIYCYYYFLNWILVIGFLGILHGGKTIYTNDDNVEWATNSNYIDSGDTTRRRNTSLPIYRQRLRFFPKHLAKSCCELPMAPNVPYLFRLWFVIGTYIRFQNLLSSAFYIEIDGLYVVENVTITNSHPINYEGIRKTILMHYCSIV
jgi:hypothetical protein